MTMKTFIWNVWSIKWCKCLKVLCNLLSTPFLPKEATPWELTRVVKIISVAMIVWYVALQRLSDHFPFPGRLVWVTCSQRHLWKFSCNSCSYNFSADPGGGLDVPLFRLPCWPTWSSLSVLTSSPGSHWSKNLAFANVRRALWTVILGKYARRYWSRTQNILVCNGISVSDMARIWHLHQPGESQ